MKKVEIVIVILSVVLISSCTQSIKSKKSLTISKNKTDLSSVRTEYAFVKNIEFVNDSILIDADFIQYLTGLAAINAAKKDGEADVFVNKNNDTTYAVPNDYYIVNKNDKIRRLLLSKSISFDLIINPDRAHPIKNNSLQSFGLIYKDSPFILTIESNEVTRIKELFLP